MTAFRYNQLTEVVIPASVTDIRDGAFYDNAISSLTLSDGLEKIGISAFAENNLSEITLPASVILVNQGAFSSNSLVNVTFNEGLKSINQSAFQGNLLTEITVPESVDMVGSEAFGSNLLKKIDILGPLKAHKDWINNQKDLDEVNPIKFDGWYSDPNLNVEAPQIPDSQFPTILITYNKAMTLHGKWDASKVVFVANDGWVVRTQRVERNGNATPPEPEPQQTGYKLTGWYTNKQFTSKWDFANTVTNNMVLYANWELISNPVPDSTPIYAVTFNTNGGSEVSGFNVSSGAKLVAPTASVKAGYTFAGWYKDAAGQTPWNFAADTVTASTTLYAKWASNRHVITFASNGGSNVASQTVKHNDEAAIPKSPSKSGYVFAGWFADAALTDAWKFKTAPVTADITLYARWTPVAHTVTFNANGGTKVASVKVGHNQEAAIPKGPIRNGYVFAGWYTTSSLKTKWKFSTAHVSSDVTLYAKWIKISKK